MIDILLATYNGEKYLPEQLQSIERQSYPNWRLIARDDCSKDTTSLILQDFAKRHPNKVLLLPTTQNLGVVGNFSAAMEASTAPYAALCDQDDVWDCDKLSIMLTAIQELEKQHSAETPLLVHSDLRLVTSDLKPIASSFWRYTHLYPQETTTLNRLLAQNVVTGCALLCNRALLQFATPLPRETLMHDWWLALTASALGKIGVIDRQTLNYRQHGKNTLGAIKFCSPTHIRLALKRIFDLSSKKNLQAKVFLDRFSKQLSLDSRATLQTYLALKQMPAWKSRWVAWSNGFHKQGFLRQLCAFFLLKQP